MKLHFILILFCLSSLFPATIYAKGHSDADTAKAKVIEKFKPVFYVGNATDGAIFSTATIQRPNLATGTNTNTTGIVRFSFILNTGLTFNYDFSKLAGIYTGIDVKNVGYIDKINATTIKQRTYNIGAPLGIKLGSMKTKRYLFMGGGLDVPINYKEKQFVIRNQKQKSNEWFSARTPSIMPYVFAGYATHLGLTFKLQYYLTNFLNTNYTSNNIQIYKGYDVHLILFCIGYRIAYGKHANHFKIITPKEKAD